MFASAKLKFNQLNATPYHARLISLTMAIILAVAIIAGGSTVQAQTGELIDAIGNVVTIITDIIQGVAIAAGIAGLSIWGFSKVARPVFPQIAQIAANYIPDLLVGVAVVFVAATVVEALAGALGG